MLLPSLAWVTVVATLVLIVAGGLVTNTGSGLAVPDWPTTFGHNLFLYPWSKMAGGIFYEHSHRLLGSLVGLLTLLLALGLWIAEPRRRVRLLGAAAVLLVVAQGVLGGLRVVLREDAIAIVHGSVAHAFFALVVTLGVLTSRRRGGEPAVAVPATLRPLALAAVILLFLQIVFGALVTHRGLVDPHLAGAAAVFVLVPVLTARVRATRVPLLTRPAVVLLALLLLQGGLGVGAYLARFSGLALPGGQGAALALPVLHRLVAAMTLGAAVALLLGLLRVGPTMSGEPAAGRTRAVSLPLWTRS